MNRQHGAADYNALKTAWKLLVQAVGGLDALAACCRVGRSQISDYGNVAGDKFVPVDVVLDAETIAGRPLMTEALAARAGYSLLPLLPRADGDLAAALAEIGRDIANLFADASTALTHPRLTEDERLRLIRDLNEVARVVTGAQQILSARTGHQGKEHEVIDARKADSA